MGIYLSKSKYCKAIQCNKLLWLSQNKPEEATETSSASVLENGIMVGELARGIFGEYTNIEFDEDVSKMLDATNEQMKQAPNIITEASFSYNNSFCSVDILKNEPDGVEIYEVKSTANIKPINLDDVSYQVYVLKQLGYNVKSANLVHLNTKYIRKGKLELDKLFTIEDVTEIANDKQKEVENKIAEINKYMEQKEVPGDVIGKQCFMHDYDCPYWKYCSKNLPDKNVFDIAIMRKEQKEELYKQGKISFEDLRNESLQEKYHQQIEVDFTDEVIMDKERIQEFLKQIEYPIYFLDFEGYEKPIPEFDDSWAYEQIPFQYSIHYIENKEAEVKHLEFLAESGIDPRRILAESLIRDIPENASIVVYHSSYETTRIKELAEIFPDLREKLLNMNKHIVDIKKPFQSRWYYCKAMEGSYSIKYVLPALYPNEPELDYHNLPVVHNGIEASDTFLKLSNYTKEEQEKIRKGMLMYCGLDTYALVKVWEKLKEVVGDKK
ncbi:MAG: DUF2779 domain-containing protein [Clostridia bacterium]|nr:DUF2779 domain-containing protein [Clostridia bacterium]